jgi:hypothetical protein
LTDEPRRLLEQYIGDVQHPDVSAFELLDLLQTRSVLATLEAQISPDERQRLEEADSQLFAAAPLLVSRLLELAPLATLRRRANVSPSHWWWYLERLQQAIRT